VPDHLGVSAAELDTHARHVEAIQDEVSLAGQAGVAVRAGPDSYGRLCVVVPVMLGALQDVLVEAVGRAADGLRESADDLRLVAEHYSDSDERSRRSLEPGRDDR
jgi:hypothetical protein